jgi:RNA-binding protein
MLNSRQRAQLRGLANSLTPVFQVGKGGVNEQLIKQTDEVLEARELIKIRALETSPETPREAAEKIAAAVKADVVQVIGGVMVFYRRSEQKVPKDKRIKLVK